MSMQNLDDGQSEEEEPQYRVNKKGPDREEMVETYIPSEDQWVAKSVLDIHDPGRVSGLKIKKELFPWGERHQPKIDNYLETFLPARTSVEGNSRKELLKIFTSMFGVNEDGAGSPFGIKQFIGADDED